MSRVVHVIPGETAAGSFRLSGIAADVKDVLTLQDALSCGPLLPITDVPSWAGQRRSYWRELLSVEDHDLGREDLYSNSSEILAGDEIVLWLGVDLAEQIAQAWLPAFLGALDVRDRVLKIVQFVRGQRMEIVGLGMLNPQQIAAHPPPVTVTGRHLAELDLVWRALTSSEPTALVDYLRASSEFPFLGRALNEGLMRYPDADSGLNEWEVRILRAVSRGGPKAARVIGDALIDGYESLRAGTGGRDQVGDFWLFARMLRLGDPKLSEPALEITGSRVEYRDTEVRLTPFGQRILDGKANFVDANGIDDWVFGVHLQSEAGRVWFHRDGNLIRR
ncbi:MAG TPA: DUF1835 domain-containing protein [Polyangia bacterium]|nr:DUF1835 domain-containing protein [Polyangia bacterium]